MHSVAPSDQQSFAIVCGVNFENSSPAQRCHRGCICWALNPPPHNDHASNWSSIYDASWPPWEVDCPGHGLSTSIRRSSFAVPIHSIVFLVRARGPHRPRDCSWVVVDIAPTRPLPTIRPIRVRPRARRKEIAP
jgi:hypothetical protein